MADINDIANLLQHQLVELKMLNKATTQNHSGCSSTDYARRYRQSGNFSSPSFSGGGGGNLTEQVRRDADRITGRVLSGVPKMIGGGLKQIGEGLDKVLFKLPSKIGAFVSGIGKALSNMIPSFIKNLVGGISDIIMGTFSIVNNILGSIYSFAKGILTTAFNNYMAMQKAVGGMAADIGLAKSDTKDLLLNFTELTDTAMKFGGSMEDIVNMIGTFSDVTGKNKLFDKNDVQILTELGLGTNLGVQGATKLVAEFDNLGISIDKVSKSTNTARDLGAKLGLNVSKILSQYQSLVTGLTGFQMKSGLDNMVRLATQATQLRMDITQISQKMSDAFFDPEGAVEAAAKMQVLGGQFAEKFGDAFELMYKAQNTPEEFAKDLMDATKGLAQKNGQGVFYIPPAQMRILKEASNGLGVDFEQMKNGAIEQAKLADKMNALNKAGVGGMFSADDKIALSNLMRFDEKQKGYVIKNSKGVDTLLENLTDTNQFKEIVEQRKKDEESAQKRMNFQERISNIFNRFTNSFTQIFAQIFNQLESSGFMKQLEDFMSSMVNLIIPGLKGLFDPKGGITSTLKDIFDGTTAIIKKVTDVMKGEGTFWDKIKNGFVTLATDVWDLISPYLKTGFGKLFEAIGHALPSLLGGRSIEASGLEMRMNAMIENKNLSKIGGGQAGFDSLVGKYAENSGWNTHGGGTHKDYERYKNTTLEPVNDALITPSGRVLKGGKGDIGVLFDHAAMNGGGNSGSGGNEIKHSGTITVRSENGKEITINDLEKIGRYTLATYLDSIKYGLDYGNANYNNSKMPITPISK
jgi:phosphotransferase system IIB component